MKTFRKWEESNLNLLEYLIEPIEIDEELFNYIGGTVSPQYCSSEFLQAGEAETSDAADVLYYITCNQIEGKFFYLGVLPEFKQEVNY